MITTKQKEERLILVTVCTGQMEFAERSLDELEDLVDTAGGVTVGRLIQNREQIHPGTYLGSGKLDELIEMIYQTRADGIVCDDELSPAQLRNMEDILKTTIMDRTLVILDIFAKHATTHEGKIQVELAQLKYRAARLVGLRASLSRLGGGIGTRGPGEKKLEADRRYIHERISVLKAELREVVRHREITRQKRSGSMLPMAAIVGYTNAGKSTLFNRLTGAGVLAEDQLFATLDPAVRVMETEEGQKLLLSDTVGFINKLPHNLIEAFRSTLEETRYADMIIHVVDASDPQMDLHMYVVYDTLRELGITDKPVITVFNKMDAVRRAQQEVRPSGEAFGEPEMPVRIYRDSRADAVFRISAADGQGVSELEKGILKLLRAQSVFVEKLFPYEKAGKVQLIRQYGQLLEEEYTEDGIQVKGYIPSQLFGQLYE
ncbi:MAG: GTPase HflX [Lachnospiraceae bacterium]|nr:GTPase HflX [Lachnospiraceae bacterium]